MGIFVRLITQVFWKNHEKIEKSPKKIAKIVKNCEKLRKNTKNAPLFKKNSNRPACLIDSLNQSKVMSF